MLDEINFIMRNGAEDQSVFMSTYVVRYIDQAIDLITDSDFDAARAARFYDMAADILRFDNSGQADAMRITAMYFATLRMIGRPAEDLRELIEELYRSCGGTRLDAERRRLGGQR